MRGGPDAALLPLLAHGAGGTRVPGGGATARCTAACPLLPAMLLEGAPGCVPRPPLGQVGEGAGTGAAPAGLVPTPLPILPRPLPSDGGVACRAAAKPLPLPDGPAATPAAASPLPALQLFGVANGDAHVEGCDATDDEEGVASPAVTNDALDCAGLLLWLVLVRLPSPAPQGGVATPTAAGAVPWRVPGDAGGAGAARGAGKPAAAVAVAVAAGAGAALGTVLVPAAAAPANRTARSCLGELPGVAACAGPVLAAGASATPSAVANGESARPCGEGGVEADLRELPAGQVLLGSLSGIKRTRPRGLTLRMKVSGASLSLTTLTGWWGEAARGCCGGGGVGAPTDGGALPARPRPLRCMLSSRMPGLQQAPRPLAAADSGRLVAWGRAVELLPLLPAPSAPCTVVAAGAGAGAASSSSLLLGDSTTRFWAKPLPRVTTTGEQSATPAAVRGLPRCGGVAAVVAMASCWPTA